MSSNEMVIHALPRDGGVHVYGEYSEYEPPAQANRMSERRRLRSSSTPDTAMTRTGCTPTTITSAANLERVDKLAGSAHLVNLPGV